MFADTGVGPDLERTHFGQPHAKLYRDGTLFRLLAET